MPRDPSELPPASQPPHVPYAGPTTPKIDRYEVQHDILNEPLYAPPAGTWDPNQDIRREPGLAAASTVENTVWDEPGLDPSLTGTPDAAQITYARWLVRHISQTNAAKSWLVAILLALAAGPFAVVGTLLSGGGSVFGIVMLVVIGPLTEELMKTAAIALTVEKKPYLFHSTLQILFCALAAGLAFAAIENLLYIYVYIENPTPTLILWRWTVCVALHTGCSLIAGFGVARVWKDVMKNHTPPKLGLMTPLLITAAVVHGVYNASALLIEMTGIFE